MPPPHHHKKKKKTPTARGTHVKTAHGPRWDTYGHHGNNIPIQKLYNLTARNYTTTPKKKSSVVSGHKVHGTHVCRLRGNLHTDTPEDVSHDSTDKQKGPPDVTS